MIKIDKRIIGGITAAALIAIINFTLLYKTPSFLILNLIAIFIGAGPIVFIQFINYKQNREIEARFPDFLRDVTDGIRSGMTLPQAIKSTENTNYGALTNHVKKIITKIDWGVPFDKVLLDFSKTSTKPVKRAVSTIIETHKSGGNITEVLEAVANSVIEVNKIKTERSSYIYGQTITGYAIFFVFLGVMIALQTFLIPGMSISYPAAFAMEISKESLIVVYKQLFSWLIVIQGAFSGLVIGKMAEGTIIAGLKHSLILVIIGYSLFTILA